MIKMFVENSEEGNLIKDTDTGLIGPRLFDEHLPAEV